MTPGLEDSFPGMEKIPGGTYMIGSNRHYPEEAPAHCGEANWAQIDLEKDDQNHLISPEQRFKVAMARQ